MRALVLRLSLVALSLSVSGCPDFDDLPPCEKKAIACRNECNKAGGASACFDCCTDNQGACTRGQSYSFFGCPNKE